MFGNSELRAGQSFQPLNPKWFCNDLWDSVINKPAWLLWCVKVLFSLFIAVLLPFIMAKSSVSSFINVSFQAIVAFRHPPDLPQLISLLLLKPLKSGLTQWRVITPRRGGYVYPTWHPVLTHCVLMEMLKWQWWENLKLTDPYSETSSHETDLLQ